jgi:hypothetical protein
MTAYVLTVAMIWWSFAVEGFWTSVENIITVAMVMLLKEALNFHMLLCGNNALKPKTVHLSVACYVYVAYFCTTQRNMLTG